MTFNSVRETVPFFFRISSAMYEKRFYREWMAREGLCRFEVKIDESDLLILSEVEAKDRAYLALEAIRKDIKGYAAAHRGFYTSLIPLPIDDDAPEVVRVMGEAGRAWKVGPMAAVAGAIAEQVARVLLTEAKTVVVENGGDIFARSHEPVRFALYAGEDSPFAGRLVFEMPAEAGISICTSSGRVGPSLSFGYADAVAAIHTRGAYADAAATAVGNRIREPSDVARVVAEEKDRGALHGLIACAGDQLGLWGDFELIRH